VKRSDAFPGKYLKADDLGGREHVVTIDHVAVVAVGSGDHKQTKPVCYFVGDRTKSMVVNSTNGTRFNLSPAVMILTTGPA